jgi:hypothetical protein
VRKYLYSDRELRCLPTGSNVTQLDSKVKIVQKGVHSNEKWYTEAYGWTLPYTACTQSEGSQIGRQRRAIAGE